ncbi:arsenate reductase (glutaredoxin) [Paraferrimonas sp. SM1919]|uniref:arsenate reductase (glutaredoxin) n=1 Tax=Paraferrimonas sp. SM1919 TaxID=2662263 RepID=UPI0013D3C465|nr:arsenate reductase (glutaredoxin) [Paraferrimonas sp. SM1919]
MSITIYHNPRCSKSRQTLALLEENGVAAKVVEYLKTPLTQDELASLADKLGVDAIAMTRTKEAEFSQHGLTKDSDNQQLFAAMAATPKLMERPIVVNGPKAVIGRPPENVLEII